jgi:hypothetical protein
LGRDASGIISEGPLERAETIPDHGEDGMARAKGAGNGRLEETLATLMQLQATLMQNQAAFLARASEIDARIAEMERERVEIEVLPHSW